MSYRRSTGTSRGEARRLELLERVTDDLVANGLVDFSLRRAARAAGATHKVLLYHFDGVDDLLMQAVVRLRERRIGNALAVLPPDGTLGDRARAIWAVLHADESGLRVLDQVIGLSMYDPGRYRELAQEASQQYMPVLLAICPDHWPERRKLEVASLIMAAIRGFLVDWLTTGETAGATAGLEALVRALDHEEAAGS